MWLFLAFLLVPLIEIALFIQVGSAIGLWMTLLIVVLTALIGTITVRRQGGQVLARLQQAFQSAQDPSGPLADGVMILFSGMLLLTPGFFTDAIGFALLVPMIRGALFQSLRKHIHIQRHSTAQARPDIMDGDYNDVTPATPDAPKINSAHHQSGWTSPPHLDSTDP